MLLYSSTPSPDSATTAATKHCCARSAPQSVPFTTQYGKLPSVHQRPGTIPASISDALDNSQQRVCESGTLQKFTTTLHTHAQRLLQSTSDGSLAWRNAPHCPCCSTHTPCYKALEHSIAAQALGTKLRSIALRLSLASNSGARAIVDLEVAIQNLSSEIQSGYCPQWYNFQSMTCHSFPSQLTAKAHHDV